VHLECHLVMLDRSELARLSIFQPHAGLQALRNTIRGYHMPTIGDMNALAGLSPKLMRIPQLA